MNKAEFIRKLKMELVKLPKEELEDVIQYYTEYLEEAEDEAKAIEELGSPNKIAAQIKADYAVKQLDKMDANSKQKNKGISTFWLVILGIFAAPVALPIAIAGGAVALTLFISAICISGSLLICTVLVFVCGILAVIAGVIALFVNFANGVIAIGLGLIFVGVTLLLGTGIVFGTRALFRFIAKYMNKRRQEKSKGKGDKKDEERV